jgi:hypothetical protein
MRETNQAGGLDDRPSLLRIVKIRHENRAVRDIQLVIGLMVA